MHVLFVSTYYRPHTGGLEILTEQVAIELRARGHEVSVVTSIGPGDVVGPDELQGIPVWRNDLHGAVARRDYAGIVREQHDSLRVVTDLRPDIVHAHDAMPWTWLYLRLVRGTRPPVVQTLHTVMTDQLAGGGPGMPGLPGLRTVLRDVDWVTGVSREVVADALRLEPAIADRVSCVVNGVPPPVDAFEPVLDGPALLVCVGRLSPEKGFDRAIWATATLVGSGHDVRLRIVGDGRVRAQLASLADQLGVADRVELVGDVPHEHVAAHLRAATVVVMPSRFEGLPIAALEAAAMGRPIVGADVPGLREAVADGETGLIVSDDDQLARAIEDLVRDRDRARALGAAARARVLQSFSLAACADGYLDVYERLVSPGDDRGPW